MIQIRNVPDELHAKLKAQAALAGLSLSDYVLAQIRSEADKPDLKDMLAHLPRYGDQLRPSSAEIVRAERDSR